MRKLVILGNGFDRAHELNTSYYHFIKHIIDRSINHDSSVREELIDVGYLFHENQSFEVISSNYNQLARYPPSKRNEEKIVPKNKLLHQILRKSFDRDWFDIESQYFEILSQTPESEIEQTNQEFDIIKNYLLDYLKLEIQGSQLTIIPELLDCFNEDNPSSILFLNFNYTKTIDNYWAKIPTSNKRIINIHGNLENDHNPMVFGYGDDTDQRYIDLVNKDNNLFLRNLKRQQYKLAKPYEDLLVFLRQRERFNIQIMGHSLGLTDKTLLKEIFEHKNAFEIKFFYHNDREGYRKLNDNISRIVNTSLLNQKLIDFPRSKAMPQLSE